MASLWGGREHRITIVSVPGGEPSTNVSTNLYLLRRPESVSELSSFVSQVGSSSAEGENEVSRERFAIFHETMENITLEETILLSPALMFQRSDFIIRPWVQWWPECCKSDANVIGNIH